jgi:ribonuclease HII
VLRIERKYWAAGLERLAGVDEAGRGPLAGPVAAAAVVIDPRLAEDEECGALAGITDSKRLSQSRREFFSNLLLKSEGVEVGLAFAAPNEIDELNILRATHLAMARALRKLASLPDHVLVDGLAVQDLPCPSTPIVGGDRKSLLIAAASIVAKVGRDAHMCEMDRLYPQYGFARHKGYGTRAHIRALYEHGPSPIHRHSFRPVREAAANRAGLPG